jgi:hypothetical protein
MVDPILGSSIYIYIYIYIYTYDKICSIIYICLYRKKIYIYLSDIYRFYIDCHVF